MRKKLGTLDAAHLRGVNWATCQTTKTKSCREAGRKAKLLTMNDYLTSEHVLENLHFVGIMEST